MFRGPQTSSVNSLDDLKKLLLKLPAGQPSAYVEQNASDLWMRLFSKNAENLRTFLNDVLREWDSNYGANLGAGVLLARIKDIASSDHPVQLINYSDKGFSTETEMEPDSLRLCCSST